MKRLFVFALLSGCLSAQAAIEDHGDYTLDTETGFIWPDLTETRGLSYNEVTAEFGFNGDFYGCRVATQNEAQDLLGKLGLSPTGGTWQSTSGCLFPTTLYCGPPIAGEAETLEDAIRLLGDTRDAFLDETADSIDVAPTGAGWTKAHIAYSQGGTLWLRDEEYIDRSTGLPLEDLDDAIRAAGLSLDHDTPYADGGTLLICDTWPITPLDVDVLDFQEIPAGSTSPIITKGYELSGDTTAVDIGGDISIESDYNDCDSYCGGGGPGFYWYTSMGLERSDGKPFALYAVELENFGLYLYKNFGPDYIRRYG